MTARTTTDEAVDPDAVGTGSPEGLLARTRVAFGTPAGFIAVLVLLGQVSWLAVVLHRGYWTQDDYLVLRRAVEEPFGLDYLGSPFAGEFSPLGHLLVRGMFAADLLRWEPAFLMVLALQALVGYLLWLVLTEVLGHRWARLPLLTLACFSPLVVPSALWFSLALLHLPAAVGFLSATLVLLTHLRAGSGGGRAAALGWLLLALFSSDQALLHPVALFALVAVCLPAPEASPGTRLVRAFMAAPRFWLLVLVATGARVALGRAARQTVEDWATLTQATAENLSTYVRQLLVGIVGGPWDGTVQGTVVSAPGSSAVVTAGFVCLLAGWLLYRRGTGAARTALLAAVLYLLAGGAQYLLVGTYVSLSGHQRFLADAVVVTVVIVAAGLRGVDPPERVARGVARVPGTLAVAASLVVLASCTLTLRVLVPAIDNSEDREYVETLRADLRAEPRTVLLDGPVPEMVMSSLLGEEARVSTVAALVPEAPVFDLPSEILRTVDLEGRLQPVTVSSQLEATGRQEESCPWAVRYAPTAILFDDELPAGRNLLTLGYFTSLDTFATVDIGEEQKHVPIRRGVHEVMVPFEDSAYGITVSLESEEGTACFTDVSFGTVETGPRVR